MYKKLSVLEIVYYDNGALIDTTTESLIIGQLRELCSQMYCISIVVNNSGVDFQRLARFLKLINSISIPISLTYTGDADYGCLSLIKEDINQIRIKLNERQIEETFLLQLYNCLKTTKNNVIFLIELQHKGAMLDYAQLLSGNSFIFNYSYNHNLNYDDYWEIARYVSSIKERFPQKVFCEFTCAGLYYDSLKGICPARTILMCVGVHGEIKFCYKDINNHGLNVCDGKLNDLFLLLSNQIPHCQEKSCDDVQYEKCKSGCPLDISQGLNKYCKYNVTVI